jgi:putative hemolysin
MTDIVIILILVAFNGFFSLAEVALISARRSRLQTQAKEGSRAARTALELMDDPDKFLSTAQIGITIVSILTGIYSGETLADDFATLLTGYGLSATLAPAVAKTLIVIVATYLQCELGELFPKRIGIDLADRAARLCAPLMMFFSRVSFPFVWLLSHNTELLIRLCHLHRDTSHVTEEEIKTMIQEGADAGEVQEVEQDIMERALSLGDRKVESLMTPRADLVTLDSAMSAAEVESVIRSAPFAAYPVVDGSLDNILGLVTLKDLVLHLSKDDFSLAALCHEPVYFPETMTVYKALERLKSQRLNRALVCDEFGLVQGIISLKDILEGLVGSIDDPTEEPDIVTRADGCSWVVSGSCSLYDFLTFFNKEECYTTEYTSVGGLLLDLLQHIPHEGERITWKGLGFRILRMDDTRIESILVKLN